MLNSLQSNHITPLRSIVAPTLFGDLGEQARRNLLERAPLRSFGDQQIMQQQGDIARGFWVIESGTVKIGMYKPDGEFRLLVLLGKGDSYGELALFAKTPRAVDAVADGTVTARWIDAAAFERAIGEDPDVLRKMVATLSIQLQETLNLLSALGAGSAHARIAATLLNLGRQLPSARLINLGHQELGELTGLTRVTVNKSLKRLEQLGAVRRHYRKLELIDLHVLSVEAATL